MINMKLLRTKLINSGSVSAASRRRMAAENLSRDQVKDSQSSVTGVHAGCIIRPIRVLLSFFGVFSHQGRASLGAGVLCLRCTEILQVRGQCEAILGLKTVCCLCREGKMLQQLWIGSYNLLFQDGYHCTSTGRAMAYLDGYT